MIIGTSYSILFKLIFSNIIQIILNLRIFWDDLKLGYNYKLLIIPIDNNIFIDINEIKTYILLLRILILFFLNLFYIKWYILLLFFRYIFALFYFDFKLLSEYLFNFIFIFFFIFFRFY